MQYVSDYRHPDIYNDPNVTPRDATLTSAILFAYKLNWQSVLFLGYGDNQVLNDQFNLTLHDRQVFLKISYAFQK